MIQMIHYTVLNQVEGIAQRRGFQMDFEDLWRFRSRDVRGAQSHL